MKLKIPKELLKINFSERSGSKASLLQPTRILTSNKTGFEY
jgi:hypothetical protein